MLTPRAAVGSPGVQRYPRDRVRVQRLLVGHERGVSNDGDGVRVSLGEVGSWVGLVAWNAGCQGKPRHAALSRSPPGGGALLAGGNALGVLVAALAILGPQSKSGGHQGPDGSVAVCRCSLADRCICFQVQ